MYYRRNIMRRIQVEIFVLMMLLFFSTISSKLALDRLEKLDQSLRSYRVYLEIQKDISTSIPTLDEISKVIFHYPLFFLVFHGLLSGEPYPFNITKGLDYMHLSLLPINRTYLWYDFGKIYVPSDKETIAKVEAFLNAFLFNPSHRHELLSALYRMIEGKSYMFVKGGPSPIISKLIDKYINFLSTISYIRIVGYDTFNYSSLYDFGEDPWSIAYSFYVTGEKPYITLGFGLGRFARYRFAYIGTMEEIVTSEIFKREIEMKESGGGGIMFTEFSPETIYFTKSTILKLKKAMEIFIKERYYNKILDRGFKATIIDTIFAPGVKCYDTTNPKENNAIVPIFDPYVGLIMNIRAAMDYIFIPAFPKCIKKTYSQLKSFNTYRFPYIDDVITSTLFKGKVKDYLISGPYLQKGYKNVSYSESKYFLDITQSDLCYSRPYCFNITPKKFLLVQNFINVTVDSHEVINYKLKLFSFKFKAICTDKDVYSDEEAKIFLNVSLLGYSKSGYYLFNLSSKEDWQFIIFDTQTLGNGLHVPSSEFNITFNFTVVALYGSHSCKNLTLLVDDIYLFFEKEASRSSIDRCERWGWGPILSSVPIYYFSFGKTKSCAEICLSSEVCASSYLLGKILNFTSDFLYSFYLNYSNVVFPKTPCISRFFSISGGIDKFFSNYLIDKSSDHIRIIPHLEEFLDSAYFVVDRGHSDPEWIEVYKQFNLGCVIGGVNYCNSAYIKNISIKLVVAGTTICQNPAILTVYLKDENGNILFQNSYSISGITNININQSLNVNGVSKIFFGIRVQTPRYNETTCGVVGDVIEEWKGFQMKIVFKESYISYKYEPEFFREILEPVVNNYRNLLGRYRTDTINYYNHLSSKYGISLGSILSQVNSNFNDIDNGLLSIVGRLSDYNRICQIMREYGESAKGTLLNYFLEGFFNKFISTGVPYSYFKNKDYPMCLKDVGSQPVEQLPSNLMFSDVFSLYVKHASLYYYYKNTSNGWELFPPDCDYSKGYWFFCYTLDFDSCGCVKCDPGMTFRIADYFTSLKNAILTLENVESYILDMKETASFFENFIDRHIFTCEYFYGNDDSCLTFTKKYINNLIAILWKYINRKGSMSLTDATKFEWTFYPIELNFSYKVCMQKPIDPEILFKVAPLYEKFGLVVGIRDSLRITSPLCGGVK